MALEGKHALITGSSRGIGRGIALALAESGAKVAIHYFQNEGAAKETLEQVRKRGSDGFLVQADVTRPDQITEMFQKVKAEFGKLDLFVSNARPEASTFFQPPLDITLEQWDALRCWGRGHAVLFGESALDYGTADLCRRRRILDESRGAARDTDRITADKLVLVRPMDR